LMLFTSHYTDLCWLHGFVSFVEKCHLFAGASFFIFDEYSVQNYSSKMHHLIHCQMQHLCFGFLGCCACLLDLLLQIYLFCHLLFLIVQMCKSSNLIYLVGLYRSDLSFS